MDTKTFTRTIKTEVTSVPIVPGWVLAYVREDETVTTRVMREESLDEATSATDLVSEKVPAPHLPGYWYSFVLIFPGEMEAIDAGSSDWMGERPTLRFGDPVPDGTTVLGFCFGDYTFIRPDGTLVNRAYVDFYLDRDYRIGDILSDFRAGKLDKRVQVKAIRGRVQTYFVPGNGETINLSIRMTDEEYAELVRTRNRSVIVSRYLGKYRRETPLEDDDD